MTSLLGSMVAFSSLVVYCIKLDFLSNLLSIQLVRKQDSLFFQGFVFRVVRGNRSLVGHLCRHQTTVLVSIEVGLFKLFLKKICKAH